MSAEVKCRSMYEGLRFYPETFLQESKDAWPDAGCSHCGELLDVGATIWVTTWRESRGEFWGAPCSETMSEEWCDECAKTLGKPIDVQPEIDEDEWEAAYREA